MFVEVVSIDKTLQSKENSLEFDLEQQFHDNHQIDRMFEDPEKGQAFFYTQSNFNSVNQIVPFLIDYVAVLKISIGADEKITVSQLQLMMPEKEVCVRVFYS